MKTYTTRLQEHIVQAHEVLELMLTDQKLQLQLEQAAALCVEAIRKGRKILICGNGGSATLAQHLAAELIGRFKEERAALPAIALTADSSVLTALGNDYGFTCIFSRQIAALGNPGDVLISMSTSGRSVNIVNAMSTAFVRKMSNIAITGGIENQMSKLADIGIRVPAESTDRIQEAHLLIVHLLSDMIEQEFSKP